MKPGLVGDLFAGVFVLSLLYVLVRPQSVGAQAIDAVTGAAVALVRRVTT